MIIEGKFRRNDGPIDRGGDGGDDGGMEARIAKLEASVEHIRSDTAEVKSALVRQADKIDAIRTTDFRLLFGAIIAVALGLAGIMAKGFHWI